MKDVMDRMSVKALKRAGKQNKEIAEIHGMDPKTVKSILEQPADVPAKSRDRKSQVDDFVPDIRGWLERQVPVQRMLELASEAEPAYKGGRSEFYRQVRKVRQLLKLEEQEAFVRFEGLAGEYCQIDWGEDRNLKFATQEGGTRYFFVARLKFSRMSYVEFTTDMKLETLLRCMIRAFAYFGGVPWNSVFDNMKTVTSGRDEQHKPIWNPTFLKLMVELECNPLACWPASGNQKGAVENLVGWVKSNFLQERTFVNDADLNDQAATWTERVNGLLSKGHNAVPIEVHAEFEKRKLIPLKESAAEYGLFDQVKANPDSLVNIDSNRYSVPVGYIGRALVARIRQSRIDFYSEVKLVASHVRALERRARPIRVPEHYEAVFAKKPRAQVGIYRDHLCELDASIDAYMSGLCFRFRGEAYGPHILAIYKLWQQFGTNEIGAACAIAGEHGSYGSEYIEALLRRPKAVSSVRSLDLAVPTQQDTDRPLAVYEAHVERSGN